MEYGHQPAMLKDVLTFLDVSKGGIYVDGTVGAGGHALEILKKMSFLKSNLWVLDRDLDALNLAKKTLSFVSKNVKYWHTTFDSLDICLEKEKIKKVDGIFLDLGVSSIQFDNPVRGFSFRFQSFLDMRMNLAEDAPRAMTLVNELGEAELGAIFRKLGEEPQAYKIAKLIVKSRKIKPILTTFALAKIVEKVVRSSEKYRRKLHPATKVFMALRLKVNDELGCLKRFLNNVLNWLNPGGRLIIISYHSLEDRMIKKTLHSWANPCDCSRKFPFCVCHKKVKVSLPFRKPLRPKLIEIENNPRIRSAKLRVAIKSI